MSKSLTLTAAHKKRDHLPQVPPSIPASLERVIDAVLTTPPLKLPLISRPTRHESDKPEATPTSE